VESETTGSIRNKKVYVRSARDAGYYRGGREGTTERRNRKRQYDRTFGESKKCGT
jgi:hypothetical protein